MGFWEMAFAVAVGIGIAEVGSLIVLGIVVGITELRG